MDASTRTRGLMLVSTASIGIPCLWNFIPLHLSMFKRLRAHLAPCPSDTARSHVGVSLKTSRRAGLHLAVRGINRPLMSKTPMCLLVICLLVSLLGAESFTSVLDVVPRRNILVQGASLPRTTRPKCRGGVLSSSRSIMGCQVLTNININTNILMRLKLIPLPLAIRSLRLFLALLASKASALSSRYSCSLGSVGLLQGLCLHPLHWWILQVAVVSVALLWKASAVLYSERVLMTSSSLAS